MMMIYKTYVHKNKRINLTHFLKNKITNKLFIYKSYIYLTVYKQMTDVEFNC